jgi:Resolvase, N terminal domain
MALVGYARISTDDGRQTTLRQLEELRAAGCAEILEEHASGADRARPVLNRLLACLEPGTTVCVAKLDRLARSTKDLDRGAARGDAGPDRARGHDLVDLGRGQPDRPGGEAGDAGGGGGRPPLSRPPETSRQPATLRPDLAQDRGTAGR